MELKKNPKVDLESMKSIFFMLGILLSLVVVFIAFNLYSSPPVVDELQGFQYARFEEEQTPATYQKYIPPAPLPPPPVETFDNFNILENDKNINNEVLPQNEDFNPETSQNFNNLLNQFGESDDEIIYLSDVDKLPEFPGGELGLRKFIATNLQYPKIASEKKIAGIVVIKFCVTYSGTVDRVEITHGVDPVLDNEALRVVKTMPRWTPGERLGKKVSVWYNLPINFNLNR